MWWPSLGLLLWEFCNAQWLGLHYKTGGGERARVRVEREKTQDALQPAHTKWTVIESSAELWMCHLLRLYSSCTSASSMKCHLSCQTPTLWSSISSNYTHTRARLVFTAVSARIPTQVFLDTRSPMSRYDSGWRNNNVHWNKIRTASEVFILSNFYCTSRKYCTQPGLFGSWDYFMHGTLKHIASGCTKETSIIGACSFALPDYN